MGVGISIFLLAVGAILTFAVSFAVSGVSLPVIGIILMCAGALGLILTIFVFAPRSRRSTYVDDYRDDLPPAAGERRRRVVEDRDVY